MSGRRNSLVARQSRVAAFLDALDSEARMLADSYEPTPILASPQGGRIELVGHPRSFVNLCSNDYLGFANSSVLIGAATEAMQRYGFGVASVRFICGTQDLHKSLETRISAYLKTEDALLFAACFDANGGLFEPLFGENDAIVSDGLNHASIIDGIRLSRAKRFRYASGDMDDLEVQLKSARAAGSQALAIVTDGAFSMDGTIANLSAICGLAQHHDALVIVDDSHAVGVLGPQGRGTPSLLGVSDAVHILTGTFGKALGGALGGYVAGPRGLIEVLRHRARPYLFSNSLPPPVVAAAIAAIDLAEAADQQRVQLAANARQLRVGLEALGLPLLGANHPIVPVLLGDTGVATAVEGCLRKEGILARAFTYPVVPRGGARVRCQVSAAHTSADIEQVLGAFEVACRLLQCT